MEHRHGRVLHYFEVSERKLFFFCCCWFCFLLCVCVFFFPCEKRNVTCQEWGLKGINHSCHSFTVDHSSLVSLVCPVSDSSTSQSEERIPRPAMTWQSDSPADRSHHCTLARKEQRYRTLKQSRRCLQRNHIPVCCCCCCCCFLCSDRLLALSEAQLRTRWKGLIPRHCRRERQKRWVKHHEPLIWRAPFLRTKQCV